MDGSLERKHSNAKYIRKKLTEDGKVRYIYKESQPRNKKVEEVPQDRKNRFAATLDSTDKSFRSLFLEAIDEIDDIHYVCINSGCGSVQMTNDLETFFDILDVPPEYQEKEVFRAASGCYNVTKGKIAFCLDNFPRDISEIVKKTIMLHETMHGFFYGALRLKHKKPLTADSSDEKMDKEYVKKAIKFVDSFGKIDQNMRKHAESSITEVKGQDKETLLLNQMNAAMISEFAAISPEEHFAEAGAYYFMLPNVLKTKEAEVYKAFNEFFEKYED